MESLTSYMRRLAAAHVVSPVRLVELLITGPQRAQGVSMTFASAYTEALNADGHAPRVFLATLQTLTGVADVERTALGARVPALYWQRSMRTNRAWCPECLHSSEPYDQLLWSFKAYGTCVIHRRPLVDRCAACNRTHRAFMRKAKPGMCPCGAAMGALSDGEVPVGAEERVLVDLVARLERGLWLTQDEIRAGTRAFIHASGQLVAAGKRAGMTHSGVRVVAQGGRVGPETLIALLAGAGQTLDTFCDQPAVPLRLGRRPNHNRGGKRRKSALHLEPVLRALLAGPDDTLPSFDAFRKQHGVEGDSLHMQLPELSAELVARGKRARAARGPRRQQEQIAQIRTLAHDIAKENGLVTFQMVRNRLSSIGIQPVVLLDAVIRDGTRAVVDELSRNTGRDAA